MVYTWGDLLAQILTPLVLCCVRGEEWPTNLFEIGNIRARDGSITEKSIVLSCPAGHRFSLKQALKKGIFTLEQVQRLLIAIEKANEPLPISEDEKIVNLGLSCVRCGKKAQMAMGRDFPLCLGCYEAWLKECDGEVFKLSNRTSGKPWYLFWDALFKRFVEKLPPLDHDAALELLQQCRKQAKLYNRTKYKPINRL